LLLSGLAVTDAMTSATISVRLARFFALLAVIMWREPLSTGLYRAKGQSRASDATTCPLCRKYPVPPTGPAMITKDFRCDNA
jgi:hypothetical protein